MAEKLTDKGLVVGLIPDEEEPVVDGQPEKEPKKKKEKSAEAKAQ